MCVNLLALSLRDRDLLNFFLRVAIAVHLYVLSFICILVRQWFGLDLSLAIAKLAQLKCLLGHLDLALEGQKPWQHLGLTLDERLNLSESSHVSLGGSLYNLNPVDLNQSLEPCQHSELVRSRLFLLELSDNKGEELADSLVFLQVKQG